MNEIKTLKGNICKGYKKILDFCFFIFYKKEDFVGV